jgi:hypothetical protein
MQKIFGSPQWPVAQNEFRIRIARRIRNRIRNKCCKLNRGTNGIYRWTSPGSKISRYYLFKGSVKLALSALAKSAEDFAIAAQGMKSNAIKNVAEVSRICENLSFPRSHPLK